MNWDPSQYQQPPQQSYAQQPPPGAQGPYVPPGAPPPGYPPPGAQGPYVPPGAPPPGYPPPGAQGPYVPPGAPPPGYPPPGAQGPYVPPGAPPPGYPPPGAQGPYVPPGAPPPGYPPPGAQGPYVPMGQGVPAGYSAQGAIVVAPFSVVVPNFDSERDPELPQGSCLFVCTGQIEIVADGKLLKAEAYCEKSSNPNSIGQKGWWKCWLQRPGIKGNGGAQAASNDLARFALTLGGRDFKQTDGHTAMMVASEFVSRFTVNGRPIAGLRFGADVTHKLSKAGNLYASCVFHVLPPGA